tara:strand:+ start:165 stop:563 length:399 start_codon:yes stop_codon:yes gene_type:complete
MKKLAMTLLAVGLSQMACKTSYMPKKPNHAYLSTNMFGKVEILKNGTSGEPRKLAFELNCDKQVMNFSRYSQESLDDYQTYSVLSSLSVYLTGPLGPVIFSSLAQQSWKQHHASLVDAVNANNSSAKCVNAN